MTISKPASSDKGRARPPQGSSHYPFEGSYDENYDPRLSTVSIGVSLITVETDSFIQDDRHVEIPVDDDIVYLTVAQ